ncbi:sensor histidine kinase [Hymenobacter sp.]|jgi:signal transduction histidine kinase|uniref:sensor histidine kinase n=1 Tax=Hymenobacter sp. TaxID=1898978 RepID=UPI002ED7A9FC
MDQPKELEFVYLLGIGTVMILLLVMVVVVFVIVHQKRAHSLQAHIRQQEIEYQLRLLQSVVDSQESERERIAQDLHDEIGASLSAARLFINQVQYEVDAPHLQEMTQQASQILGETLQSVRVIVQHLSPALLERFGLSQAVTMLGARLERAGLRVELHVDEAVDRLAPEIQLALYRIVQELLANVTKHAQAHCLLLHLGPYPGGIKLVVSDDGRGFSADFSAAAKPVSMGLSGIQARAKLLQAELKIRSTPGEGTHASLLVPA